ncbi:MAG: FAD:protein FMN transferase [Rhodoplanes sp.]|uniref:FAD:protein FMN transferase n=1 Tax=Rhodoplanes sp. TaxID=1968906 RepID=UPI00182BE49E|nr:FAD:protein FMN transferase [Rhodoplanes sp.]NVO12463.1 FAD:protein FMN transferase [Rhodoplanes sp.]
MRADVPRAGVTRRRFVAVTAAAAGFALLPAGLRPRADEGALVTWTGVALGAVASLRIHHPDRAEAERLVAAAVAETRRLEAIFSLWRDDSALAVLNRSGVLVAPPPELVTLLEACGRVNRLTGGVFDPTVQPLWDCYVAHFSAQGRDAGPPPAVSIAAALAKVGFDKLRLGRDRIAFARRGMAVTLNGIAQGFITDRVVALLRDAGLAHALVDMGEIRAIGDHPAHRPWHVALEGAATQEIDVVDRAVATSAAAGFRFDTGGRCNHLFDPRTGGCADASRRVTVVADDATTADALSSAFSLMDEAAIARVLGERPDIKRIA